MFLLNLVSDVVTTVFRGAALTFGATIAKQLIKKVPWLTESKTEGIVVVAETGGTDE